jgi:hypothetical protein
MPLHLGFVRPVQNCVAGELGAVVAHHHLWRSTLQYQLIEFRGKRPVSPALFGVVR